VLADLVGDRNVATLDVNLHHGSFVGFWRCPPMLRLGVADVHWFFGWT
jgi:hypothetical protein